MTDPSQGVIREEILNEKILSAIVEIKTALDKVPSVLQKIRNLSREVDTVISVGVSTRCDAQGNDRLPCNPGARRDIRPIAEKQTSVWDASRRNRSATNQQS